MTPQFDWTVMVYLAGDNNLSEECLYALTEMRKVAPSDKIRIIAQFDPQDDYLPTHRYQINKPQNGNGKKRGQQSKAAYNATLGSLNDDILDAALIHRNGKDASFENESKRAKAHDRERIAADAAKIKAGKAAAKQTAGLGKAYAGTRKGLGVGHPSKASVLLDDVPDIDNNDTDTGSPVTLYNFMSYCVANFPAKHYMVVLSGHGAGTERDYLLRDGSPSGYLTLRELKRAFRELKPELKRGQVIDILGMDTCLMSMVEVCYELKAFAKIMIGCESYSPASGWPYQPILDQLRKIVESTNKKVSRQNDRIEFAKAIVEEYVNFYADYWLSGLSVDQSALDVGKIKGPKGLKALIDKLASRLTADLKRENSQAKKKEVHRRKYPFKDSLILAHWEAQSYNGEQFVDLFDFCTCLQRRTRSQAITNICEELTKFIQSEFVLKSCYSGPAYQYSYGASIYFPWSKVATTYSNLDFVAKGAWGKFLETYIDLTRRQPNPVPNSKGLIRSNSTLPRPFRMSEGRMSEGRMSEGKMSEGKGSNPVHSMRNPPIVAAPDICIRNRRAIIKAAKALLQRKS